MNKQISILIIENERTTRDFLAKWFTEEGSTMDSAENTTEALRQLRLQHWEIILLDINMPDIDLREIQQYICKGEIPPTLILITAQTSAESALHVLKMGAVDYITKPINPDHLARVIANSIKQRRLEQENIKLRERILEFTQSDEIVGESQQMRKVFNAIQAVSPTDTTVMIRGESGTGKELIARAIHANSERRFCPIVTINCGSLPEGMLEGELFGYERGTMDGSPKNKRGKIELADGGTLFLNEVGNIGMKIQLDLLRILESKQFTRVGGNQCIAVDFRVVCTTNKDLEQLVRDGSFRKELYRQLSTLPIVVPPLRERKSDIALLANYFVTKYAQSMGKSISSITPEAMEILLQYHWPGNVRELENAIERALVIGTAPSLKPEDLPFQLTATKRSSQFINSLSDIGRAHIISVLDQNHWNISRSANILQIDRVTLYNKIHKYGLKRPA